MDSGMFHVTCGGSGQYVKRQKRWEGTLRSYRAADASAKDRLPSLPRKSIPKSDERMEKGVI